MVSAIVINPVIPPGTQPPPKIIATIACVRKGQTGCTPPKIISTIACVRKGQTGCLASQEDQGSTVTQTGTLPFATLYRDNTMVAQSLLNNGVATFTIPIESNPRSSYSMFCARAFANLNGSVQEVSDCRTVHLVSPAVDISAQLALQAQEVALIQRYLGTSVAVPSSALTPQNFLSLLPSIPTSPSFPSGPTVSAPQIPANTIVPQLGTITVPKIGIPIEYLQFPVSVYIDGVYVGSPPISYDVAAGKHQVSIRIKGLRQINGSYSVDPGQTVTLSGLSFG